MPYETPPLPRTFTDACTFSETAGIVAIRINPQSRVNTASPRCVPPSMKFASALVKFIFDHGLDRILSALAAFALYYLTPPSHGW